LCSTAAELSKQQCCKSCKRQKLCFPIATYHQHYLSKMCWASGVQLMFLADYGCITAHPGTPITPPCHACFLHTFSHIQVGLELSRILTNLGIIDDFSIGQRLGRVRAHSRLWDPTRSYISSSADAAGYPAMYLTLHLNYDKHKPLWCRTPLAAAPHHPADHLEYLPSSSSSSSSAIVSSSSSSVLPNPQNFTPPMGVNSPTPETVKIISKPSVQRWMGVGDLHRARKNSRPGIFLLSTHQVRHTQQQQQHRLHG
jgi:hypothetical protein